MVDHAGQFASGCSQILFLQKASLIVIHEQFMTESDD